jgi:hypothetical protein
MKREPGKMTRRRLKIDAYKIGSVDLGRQNMHYHEGLQALKILAFLDF